MSRNKATAEVARRSTEEQRLFRDDSLEAVDTIMAEDIITPPLDDTRVSTSLPSSIPGNDVNLTPIVDESVVTENLPSSPKKGKSKDTDEEEKPVPSSSSGRILASLPVYFSTSLPSSSSLQIFQYPTYPRGRPLPIPESARSRGLREAIRYRPNAKRVEVEVPLDLRPAVYDLERGEDMAKGANVAGSIGLGPNEAIKSAQSIKVKREHGVEDSNSQNRGSKRLEKSRLESTHIPNQTNYMIGVIRDKALHLSPVDTIIQMRPSMHYLDALDAMAQQEKRRAQAEPGDETDEGSITEDGGKAKEKKKAAAQNLSVSVRDNQAVGPSGARGKGVVSDSRDALMQAERDAEGERWIDLDWKDERTDESRKIFDSQLFASSKTPLECKTRPREYLV